MKVYVINIKERTDRLEQFKKNYPKCLPKPIVWNAKTGADVTAPDWWKSSANRWALVQNFIDILSEDNNEDVLIFEDDCIFTDNFKSKYDTFMKAVPDDWDMIYLGAQHYSPPRRISENVLKLDGSVCGHAIIYRNRIKQELIDYYNEPSWGCRHYPDLRRAMAMHSGKFICYSPIKSICGQSAGYSELSEFNRAERWYDRFTYIDCITNKAYDIDELKIPVNNASVKEDTKCIISLTSHKPRIPYLAEAIQGILGNKEYHVVLTLYSEDAKNLPRLLRNWINAGKLELIISDRNERTHKKYLYSFPKYSDKYPIIIIDDDHRYNIAGLESLYKASLEYPNCIISHICKPINVKDGEIKDYYSLPYKFGDEGPALNLVPIGARGVLYPKGFNPIVEMPVGDYTFGDDITLHVAAIRQGIKVKNIPGTFNDLPYDIIRSSAFNKEQKRRNTEQVRFYKEDILASVKADAEDINS